jgi:intraflagellar transport protein 88
MYHKNGQYTEALNTYSLIVRNKQYTQSGRLRVNMGNIYAEQKKYLLAIKMYRISLDEIAATDKELRYKIMRNIGNAFVKMGQYKDAIGSFEAVMEGSGDVTTGFNLLLCCYALGDVEKVKRTFTKLLSVRVTGYSPDEDEDEASGRQEDAGDVLVTDALRTEVRERRRKFVTTVTTAARLIAPMIDPDWRIGFDYVIEQLRHYEVKDTTARLASELEMCKGLNYLKFNKYREAIEGLKAFEKKDKELRARAATNLAYLYFLEGDYGSCEKYADMAVEADRYNSKTLVNKGNFLPDRGPLRHHGRPARRRLVQPPDWAHPDRPECARVPGLLNAKEGDESQAFHYYLEAYRYNQGNMDVISWLGAYFVKNEVYDKATQFFERRRSSRRRSSGS